ncbi:MAG TPA: 4a-hydroxytetrahydrobiopterin dehydratase [Candidatus Babeliales bacterium]|nr:4a-hydroxytetrahydrobiopterin dehydratase [Candidatus Babeliales bacterium]
MNPTRLTLEEINDLISNLPGWRAYHLPTHNFMNKQFELRDFATALRFVNAVGEYAQKINHHPDISISYNKVTLALWTHSAAGVTEKDLVLASQIEQIIKKPFSQDTTVTIAHLKNEVETFISEREWAQFHSLKNLSMAIAAEAAELMEPFLWTDASQEKNNESKRVEIENELADVLIASLAFANRFNTDIAKAIERKLEHNRKKYPIEKAKGRSDKYTTYIEN